MKTLKIALWRIIEIKSEPLLVSDSFGLAPLRNLWFCPKPLFNEFEWRLEVQSNYCGHPKFTKLSYDELSVSCGPTPMIKNYFGATAHEYFPNFTPHCFFRIPQISTVGIVIDSTKRVHGYGIL